MTVGVIGTTITPWMQFYLQSSIVEKGVTVRQLKASRLDVIVGSIFTDVVAWFIVVACAATLFTHGIRDINIPADAANAMKPLAGDYAFILFAAGLFNASLFAASILPLSTAYTVCEGHRLRARRRQVASAKPRSSTGSTPSSSPSEPPSSSSPTSRWSKLRSCLRSSTASCCPSS